MPKLGKKGCLLKRGACLYSLQDKRSCILQAVQLMRFIVFQVETVMSERLKPVDNKKTKKRKSRTDATEHITDVCFVKTLFYFYM